MLEFRLVPHDVVGSGRVVQGIYNIAVCISIYFEVMIKRSSLFPADMGIPSLALEYTSH